jgi:hypothetical protein
MVGLDAAGKTTILFKLKLGEVVTTIPTIGKSVTAGRFSRRWPQAMRVRQREQCSACVWAPVTVMAFGKRGAWNQPLSTVSLLVPLAPAVNRYECPFPLVLSPPLHPGFNVETVQYKNVSFTGGPCRRQLAFAHSDSRVFFPAVPQCISPGSGRA